MPSLFPSQWEPYSGLNLQKAFLVFLKINPSSLEAFVTIKLSLVLFHLAVPSLKPSTLTGINCCCFWIMLSYSRPHMLWGFHKMCTVILNILSVLHRKLKVFQIIRQASCFDFKRYFCAFMYPGWMPRKLSAHQKAQKGPQNCTRGSVFLENFSKLSRAKSIPPGRAQAVTFR